jgi:hypothetical protein
MFVTPSQKKKLDLTHHAATVAQHREYNSLPHVLQREQEYRRGPVGYPMQVINDAIRSVRTRLLQLFFNSSADSLQTPIRIS